MGYKIGEIFKDEYTHEWIQCVERPGEACDKKCYFYEKNCFHILCDETKGFLDKDIMFKKLKLSDPYFSDEYHCTCQDAVPIVKPISKDNRCHIQSDNLVSIELNDNANRYCGDICGDNRFEIIEKAKLHLIDSTNIMDSQKEMEVLDSFLFRCWQMGWLKKYE